MARIVISTFGSTGDINPFLAAGLGLRARGHDVVFCVESGFQATAERLGFATSPLTGDAIGVLARYGGSLYRRATPLASLRLLVERYIVPTLRPRIAELRAACAGADALVTSPTQIAASFVHDLDQVPYVSVTLQPVTLPSAEMEPQPTPFPAPRALRGLANRASWMVGGLAIRPMTDPPINAIRADYGLPPRRNWMWDGNISEKWAALAVSRAFIQPASDWPPQVRTIGFLFHDDDEHWAEPPALRELFEGGKPVVALSSGSMSAEIAEFAAFYREGIAGIHAVGARALVIGAPADALPATGDPDTLALPFAPFSAIYPQCAAVIHHGGSGTLAQALRSGVPMLVVPWGADQFFNGAQIARQGVGLWLRRSRFTADRVAGALGQMLADPSFHRRARVCAGIIAGEDGVGSLCAMVESAASGKVASGG
ncbi:MAG TPA: glycosyltransferase [Ktedonobacterales bacterium]